MVYEPEDVYAERNRRVSAFLTQFQQQAQAAPQRPGGLKGTVGAILGYINRPLAATSSGLAAGLRGENILTGMKEGIMGRSDITSFEDVLKQQGMAGGWQRKLAGIAGSIPLDPLMWATTPVGAGGSALMRGTRAVLPGAAKAIEATPIVRTLAGAGPVAREAPTAGRFAEQALEQAQQPLRLMERGLRAPTKIPGVGKAWQSALEVLNPKVAAGNAPMKRLSVAISQMTNDSGSVLEGLMAPISAVAAQGQRFGFGDVMRYLGFDRATGKFTLANGERLAPRFALVEANRANLTPAQAQFYDAFRASNDGLFDYAQSIGVKFEAEELPTAAEYFSGLVNSEASWGEARAALRQEPRTRGLAGTLRGRTIETPEQADALGIIYDDPLESARWHFQGMLRGIMDTKLAQYLEPYAKQQNLALIAATREAAQVAGTRVGAAELLRQMVQRVRRGEVPTQRQLGAVGKGFPELKEQLDAAMALGPREKDARATALQSVADAVKEEKGLLQITAKETSARAKEVRLAEKAAVADRQEVERVTALKNMWFKPQDAETLERALGTFEVGGAEKQLRNVLEVTQNLSAAMRTSMAAADVSAPFIQGLGFLARHPAKWLEGFARSFQAIADPNMNVRYLASGKVQRFAQELPGVQLTRGTTEWFAGMGPVEAVARRIPVVGGLAGGAVRQIYGRGSAAFDFLGNFMRVEEGTGLLKLAKETGNTAQLTEFLNKLTGVHAVAGVPETWRMFEGSFLLFAQRYTKSAMAMVLDAATRGDFVGAESRATLANMLVGGLAWYSHIADAVGQEPNFDPTTGKFLTIKVGDDNVGIGSIWVAMARFLGKAVENPGTMNPTSWENVTRDNPITQWWRSRAAPVGSVLWDKLITGEDYIGTPLDEPVQLAKYLGTKFTPFALEAFLLQNQPIGIEALGPQLAGLRTFPQSRAQIADTVAREMFGQPFTELDPVEQAEVERSERVKRVPIPAGRYGEYARAVKPVFGAYEERLGQLAEMVKANQIDKNQFRIEQTEAVKERSIRFEGVPEITRGRPKTPEEQSRQKYLDILYETDPMGDPNYEAADQFLATLPATHVTFIQQKSLANIERLPEESRVLMRELWQARQKVKAYFNLEREALQRYGLWEQYSQASPLEKQQMEQTPRYKAAQRDADRRQMALRLRDKELNQALVEWYGRAPLTLASIKRAM